MHGAIPVRSQHARTALFQSLGNRRPASRYIYSNFASVRNTTESPAWRGAGLTDPQHMHQNSVAILLSRPKKSLVSTPDNSISYPSPQGSFSRRPSSRNSAAAISNEFAGFRQAQNMIGRPRLLLNAGARHTQGNPANHGREAGRHDLF
jgi:hypothetical protein